MDLVFGFVGAIVLLTVAFLLSITEKEREDNEFTSQ